MEKTIKRINELAAKAKAGGLSPEEIVEREPPGPAGQHLHCRRVRQQAPAAQKGAVSAGSPAAKDTKKRRVCGAFFSVWNEKIC